MTVNITLKNYTCVQQKQVNCLLQSNADINITLDREGFGGN